MQAGLAVVVALTLVGNGQSVQCPVLRLQRITSRLCIRSLTEFTLCAIEIGLCFAQRIRCMTLGTGLARNGDRLARITHFLYWRCRLATGE